LKKAKLISHFRQLRSSLARGFAILLLAISVFSSYAVGQSKNQRLQEVERELQEIEVWLSENSRLKQDWLKELRLADLEVQAVKKTISQSNQRLQKSLQSLEKLEEREVIIKNKHIDLSRSLFQHIKNTYKLQKSSPLKKLLEGESIDRFDQMMRFNSYITQATLELLNDYENSLNDLERNEKKALDLGENIQKTIKEKNQSLKSLQKQAKERLSLIGKIEEAKKDKELRYQQLRLERKTLEKLVQEILPEQPDDEESDLPDFETPLIAPLIGKISKRFGEKKEDDILASQGVEISAPAGTPVQAIHTGEVVFSDWLRGFGLLLIVDHGNNYMSLYGNAEALLKTKGDQVESGELIAEAGNSGARKESGIYFEIRHRGQPIDPEPWFASK
jgi:septal ring factor EnvC (AmiA/AmiB activator)